MDKNIFGDTDLDAGVVDRKIFVDEEIYQRELETVFTRAWLFVGHQSQIPNPGDFFTSRMGEESVILVRDKKDEIHVFLNSCRHRGMKVCRYDSGNTSLFTCPYHAWTYSTDGKVRGIPQYKDLYEGVLDREKWGLIEVAQLVNYKGAVFATWDKDAPDFETYMGDALMHLDMALDCRDGRPGGSEVIGVHRWVLPTNWKYTAENFLGDSYHNPSHRSVDLIGIGPSGRAGVKGRRDGELETATHVWINFPQGHGVHSAVQPSFGNYTPPASDDPEIGEYFRECHRLRQERLGEESRLLPFTGNFFPNTGYHGGQPRGLVVWHPHGVDKTEGWRFFLVDADAPKSVKDYLRKFYMRYSGPAGMTEQDDMENWLYASKSCKGVIARRNPFNYQLSKDASQQNPTVNGIQIRGRVTTQMTEHMARGYYRRWQDYVNDADWDTLLGKHDPRHNVVQAAE
ncbi:MAG: Rieske 2Fe-2S domain-containing protein [Marinosulfonomonas sp.]|nr:Rieske 2Fe-2S domain-containing protein [Marinosulfonomonas sp.]